MHPSSYIEMKTNIDRYIAKLPPRSTIYDIGSMDVNGTYKPLVEPEWKYVGVDIEAGDNVDIIMVSDFDTGLPDGCADAVISGQCLEHCKNPFKLVNEMFRIAKKDAYVILTAPWTFPIHRYPIDCWRILPDGMRLLIEDAGGKCIGSYISSQDCWGIGKAVLH